MLLSKGNSKMGDIPNISLPPVVTCSGCAEICGKACYARKFYRMHPHVKKAWDANLEHLQRDMAGFFDMLYERMNKITYRVFRWHVGGDLISREHFAYIMNFAERLPDIKFLLFTKQFEIVNSVVIGNKVPDNLEVVFSMWPGLEVNNPFGFRCAWLKSGGETRIPEDAIECFGACDTCGMCWALSKLGRDVYFHKH